MEDILSENPLGSVKVFLAGTVKLRTHKRFWTLPGYFPKTNINICAFLHGEQSGILPTRKDRSRGRSLGVPRLPTCIATHCDSERKISYFLRRARPVQTPLHLPLVGSFIFCLLRRATENLTASVAVTRSTGETFVPPPCRTDFHSRSLSFVTFSASHTPLFTLPSSKFSFTSGNPWKFHALRDEKVEK